MVDNFLDNLNLSWTLFLDRDGVINRRIINGYVATKEEMQLLPFVKEAFAIFHSYFSRIFIVTNQQGIGKGLMTEEDLQIVHHQMLTLLGCSVTQIYYCPSLASENSPYRKPNVGMALQAKQDYPEIDFSKSIMVGDAETDVLFGKNVGMKTVFISSKDKEIECDLQCKSLFEFAKMLIKYRK